jgi:GTP-binding protein Era
MNDNYDAMQTIENNTFCGFIAIVGRPNVGKSTLLNCLVAEKISITADKPQTTRHRILGIRTINNKQAVYIDTPGIHNYNKKKINQYMNKTATNALRDVDVVIFVIEALTWKDEDGLVLDKLRKINKPIILAVNKIDEQKDKVLLLPFLEKMANKLNFADIIPISAKKEQQITELQELIFKLLPPSPYFFPIDQITDSPIKFRLAEILREKLTRNLAKELPYALTVEIERLEQIDPHTVVHAIIWVERDSQKKIVIGKGGEKLKTVGKQARLDMNKVLNCRVRLQIWVKVRAGWTDSKQALQNFGYIDIT